MNFASGFLRTIILFGAVQGFIMSTLLFCSAKNRRSNRLLSILIFLMSLASFNLYASLQNWYESSVILHLISLLVPMVIVMPFGPLIYFYIRSSIEPDFRILRKDRIHFYPVIVDLVPQLTTAIYTIGFLSGLIKRNDLPWGNFIDTFNVYSDIPRWISVTVYLGLSIKYLSDARIKNRTIPNGQTHILRWLQQFVRVFLAFQFIWLIYLIPYVIPRYTDIVLSSVDWYPIYVPLAIMVYWLGIKGYLISFQRNDSLKKSENIALALSPAKRQEIISLLNKAMEEEKLYLNPNLHLTLLARHTGVPQKVISAILNQYLRKSFIEYVNEYRVKALKQKIQQEQLNHFTIEGIAFECGFKSKATYQRVFRDFTGLSPSEFRRSLPEIQQ